MKKFGKILVLTIILAATVFSLAACNAYARNGKLVAPKITLKGETISWDVNELATGYEVRIDGNDDKIEKIKDVKIVTYNLTTSDTAAHNVQVRSTGGEVDGKTYETSDWSNKAEFKQSQQLGTPTGLNFNAATRVLSWTAVADAASYNVYLNSEIDNVTGTSYDFSTADKKLKIGADEVKEFRMTVAPIAADGSDRYNGRQSAEYKYIQKGVLKNPDDQKVELSSSSVKWKKVENATRYELTAENTASGKKYTYSTSAGTTESAAVSNLKIVDEGVYRITVRAVSDHFLYSAHDSYPGYVDLINEDDKAAGTAASVEVTKLPKVTFSAGNEPTIDGGVTVGKESGDVLSIANALAQTLPSTHPITTSTAGLKGIKVMVSFRYPGSTSSSFSAYIETQETTDGSGVYEFKKNKLVLFAGRFEDVRITDTDVAPADLAFDSNVYSYLTGSYGSKVFDIYLKLTGVDGMIDSEDTLVPLQNGRGYVNSGKPEEIKDGAGVVTGYKITKPEQLAYIWLDSANLSKNYELGANLNFSGDEIYPIGTQSAPFTGTFDGKGYSIYNFKITKFQFRKTDSQAVEIGSQFTAVGLFGVNGGTIKNLAVLGASIAADTADCYAGIVAGINNGTISEVDASGSVSAAKGAHVGGFVGRNTASIRLSTANVSTVVGSKNVGGFAGSTTGAITGCSVYFSKITGSVDVAGSVPLYVGGFVGHSSATILTSFARGESIVAQIPDTAPSYAAVGGFVGRSQGVIGTCYANVTKVTGNAGASNGARSFTGGFVGENENNIDNSYALGALDGYAVSGGFVGRNGSSISNSYASVVVKSSVLNNGAFAGKDDGGVYSNTFFNRDKTVDKNGVPVNNVFGNGTALENEGSGVKSFYTRNVAGTGKLTVEGMTAVLTGFAFNTDVSIYLDGTKITMPILKNLLYLDKYADKDKSILQKQKPVDKGVDADGKKLYDDNFVGIAIYANGGVTAENRTVHFEPTTDGLALADDSKNATLNTQTSGLKTVAPFVVKDASGNILHRIVRYITIS